MEILNYSNSMISEARQNGHGKSFIVEALKFALVYLLTEAFLSFLLEVVLKKVLSSDLAQSIAFHLIDIIGIIIVLLFVRFLEKRPISSAGFSKHDVCKQYFAGLLQGLIVFSVVFGLAYILGGYRIKGISSEANPALLIVFLICYIIQGLYEETMCRGFLMISASRKNPAIVGVLISSIAFVLIHMSNEGFGIIPAINLFLFGLFSSLLCLKTDNIWTVSAFHAMWNFAEGNIYGLSVSGMVLPQRLLVTTTSGGDMITGGLFGPEGGIPVTIVTTICALILFIDCFFPKKAKRTHNI